MSPRSTLAPTLARVAAELALVQSLVRGTLARRNSFRAENVRVAGALPLAPELEARGSARQPRDEAEALLFDLSLSEQVEPQFEQRLRLIEAERDAAYKAGEPVSQLRKAFSLTRRELTIWMLCAAPQLDYRYGRLYGLAIDDPARGYASEDLLQALLSIGLSTHAQLRVLTEASAPLRALGLIELSEAAIGKVPGLRVPSWLIDFMLGVRESVELRAPRERRASEGGSRADPRASTPLSDDSLARFFTGVSLKREHQRLVGPELDALLLLERVCARAGLKQLTLDLRRVRASEIRVETRRASHLAALRECALVVILPDASGARSEESFVLAQLARDFAQVAKHLPLCATIEEGVEE
jgi:hypothetical protein